MANEKVKKISVVIGRFSPFHNGHKYILETVAKQSHKVIVLIGSSFQSRSLKNPFTFVERQSVIEAWAKDNEIENMYIYPIRDYPYNDAQWIKSIQEAVSYATLLDNRPLEIHLTGCDKDSSTWYLHAFPQWKTHFLSEYTGQDLKTNATLVREILFSGDPMSHIAPMVPTQTLDFISKFKRTAEFENLKHEYEINRKYKAAWSVAPYAPTFNTADAVVIQSGHVLVVERGAMPGKGLWALPGGFVNQNERIQDAAIRELVEETGICLAEGKRKHELTKNILQGSIRAKEIFDHPTRSERGRTITVAYLFRLDDTKPLPSVSGQYIPEYESRGQQIVETANAFWLPINDALQQTEKWFEDHWSILAWATAIKDSR